MTETSPRPNTSEGANEIGDLTRWPLSHLASLYGVFRHLSEVGFVTCVFDLHDGAVLSGELCPLHGERAGINESGVDETVRVKMPAA